MTSWQKFEHDQPDLAGRVRARFAATKHHVLATLRLDGSPRVSGTEVAWHQDDLVLGGMPGARKAHDLRRDGRLALHANPGDGSMDGGDAKIAGRAVEVTDAEELAAFVDSDGPPTPFHLFRVELDEVVLTSLHPDGDRIVVEWWRPDEGVRRVERT